MMSQDEIKPKKQRITFPDRISLDPESLGRVKNWIEVIGVTFPGIKVVRSDIVNWLIKSHKEELSPSELKQIEAQFYDELARAKWAVDELKARLARGENATIQSVLSESQRSHEKPGQSKTPRKTQKTKEKNSTQPLSVENFQGFADEKVEVIDAK